MEREVVISNGNVIIPHQVDPGDRPGPREPIDASIELTASEARALAYSLNYAANAIDQPAANEQTAAEEQTHGEEQQQAATGGEAGSQAAAPQTAGE